MTIKVTFHSQFLPSSSSHSVFRFSLRKITLRLCAASCAVWKTIYKSKEHLMYFSLYSYDDFFFYFVICCFFFWGCVWCGWDSLKFTGNTGEAMSGRCGCVFVTWLCEALWRHSRLPRSDLSVLLRLVSPRLGPRGAASTEMTEVLTAKSSSLSPFWFTLSTVKNKFFAYSRYRLSSASEH